MRTMTYAHRVERLYAALNWRAVQAYERGDARRGQRFDRWLSKLDTIIGEEMRG